jgi:hypothetical protein
LDTAPTDTQRPVMADVASAGVFLDAGTYWVDWQTGGTLASGPWAPPVTINGQTTTGDGLQYNPTTATWGPALDSGTGTPQGMPFIIEGTAGGGGGCTPGDITWVSVDPTSGSTPAGETDTVNVTFDATGLAAGVYTGTLCVESNDPANPTVLVDLTLTVVEPGDITVDPAALSSTQEPDMVVTDTLTISNAGLGDLNWTIIESEAGTCVAGDISWASVDPTSGTTAAGGDSTVEVTFDSTGLAEGVYTGALCVQSDDPDMPEVIVPLTLTVTGGGFMLYLPVVIKAP